MRFPSIYLASQSPRRREILTQMGVDFSLLSVDVDEAYFDNESPIDYVQRVALAKAQTAWDSLSGTHLKPVLGSDTSVVFNGEILGKPINNAHASDMLNKLSNQSHQVMTAVALVDSKKISTTISHSTVHFAKLTPSDIDWYISTQEGVDKAGGYAVQGLAALFIDKIEGSYSGIMGLPIRETGLLLSERMAGNE